MVLGLGFGVEGLGSLAHGAMGDTVFDKVQKAAGVGPAGDMTNANISTTWL